MDTAHVEAALGQWDVVHRAPDPRLRPFVLHYQGYVERTAGLTTSVHVAAPIVPLIISFGAPYRSAYAGDPARQGEQVTSFVAGLHDSFVLTEHTGMSLGLQVDFTPIGAHMLTGVPAHELSNRVVAIDDVFGSVATQLVDELRDARDWQTRFATLDRFVVARLLQARDPSSGVIWAWQKLRASGGNAPVRGLADDLGWSQKRLIARFREQVGLPPKTVARILRFNRAASALDGAEARRWTQIALECGYYDQAHLIRDFREFAGSTPTAYAARRRPGEPLLAD